MSALPTPAYAPRSGSKGALALAHLRAHGRTSRVDLADAIECPAKDLSAVHVGMMRDRLRAAVVFLPDSVDRREFEL